MSYELLNREAFDYSDEEYDELYGQKAVGQNEISVKPMTRGERRRRNAIHKRHLKALVSAGCGAYEVKDENGKVIRFKRYWRSQLSKGIKKDCNRQFRRTKKINMIASQKRGWYKKTTEFWWALT